ncbi:hypothetical protein AGMMS50276_30030 [Synergistales bacterium]|nr:hypothetical protein AGMMS50276_30030 [Synergistales bacterium]
MKNKIIITEINYDFNFNSIKIHYAGEGFRYVWLEDCNRHIPNVYSLSIDSITNCIYINNDGINALLNGAVNDVRLKLSISDDYIRMPYEIAGDFENLHEIYKNQSHILSIQINYNNEIIFEVIKKGQKLDILNFEDKETEDFLLTFFNKKTDLSAQPQKVNTERLPLNVAVFGTCFSRSVFKSDPFFNPDYKRFYHVAYTAFHNSVISVMSEPIEDKDYLSIKDLTTDEVFRYIEIEFKKDFFNRLDKVKPDYLIMDNYIDASRSIIQLSDNKYLTYNTYFGRSIYKRKFANCKIINPGTQEHENLYRLSMHNFIGELKKRNLEKNFILVGGRFCESKIDEETGRIDNWANFDWIRWSNKIWDKLDKILLKEMPSAKYVDMRNTQWKSDPRNPMGQSPSHYQSGYYREVLNKINELIL